jgi:hypothetical protein
MSGQSGSEPGSSPVGAWWPAGLVFLLATLAVWVFYYLHYGEQGQLTPSETSVVALLIALLVFGARWCIMRFSRKAKIDAPEEKK